MNKFFRKSSDASDKRKMSELMFNTKMTVAILSIIACITIMLSTAFALFSSSAGYSSTLNAAVWRVHVESSDGRVVQGEYICAQTAGDLHFFTISPGGTPGASGYCTIRIIAPDETVSVYTTQRFDSAIDISITAATDCRISFTPHWGSPENFGAANLLRGSNIFHSVTPVEEEPAEEEEAPENASSESDKVASEGDGITSENNEVSSEVGDTSDVITDISSSLSDVFDIFGNSDSGDDSSASSDNTDDGSSAPSDTSSDSDGSSAPSDTSSDNDSTSAPSDNTGSVDIAPPPSSSDSGSESSSSSDSSSSSSGDSGSSSPAPSGGSDSGSSSASSGGSDSGSSSAPSGDGE